MTVYRDKSREGVLNNLSNESAQTKPSKYESFKRPPELNYDIHYIKVAGENWIVLIGLFENKPYEVFVVSTGKSLFRKILSLVKLLNQNAQATF